MEHVLFSAVDGVKGQEGLVFRDELSTEGTKGVCLRKLKGVIFDCEPHWHLSNLSRLLWVMIGVNV